MKQKDEQLKWPFLSVIIPFFNNREEVIRIEEALRTQSYPADRLELIFIDNGSTTPCNFPEPFVNANKVLKEDKHSNSPYSARNRGIESSKGEVLVFVDANSTPEKDWLKQGISCLRNSGSDLVGGKVGFDFQNHMTAGKIVDALTSINMRKAIRERGVAYTANLFVKKELFEIIGNFEEGTRSGGDVRWTLKAKQRGYKISYCESAVVKKYARSTKELYRKKIRTGRGYFQTWKQEPEQSRSNWFYNFFRSLKPPSLSKIRQISPDRYSEEFDKKIVGVWFHFYAVGITGQLAFIRELLKHGFQR